MYAPNGWARAVHRRWETERVHINEGQADIRRVYRGGLAGQLVSGVLWLVAAAVATWGSPDAAIATLFLGGMLIFPLTSLVLRLGGGPAGLPKGHPQKALATQIAFTVPLGMVVAIVLGVLRPELFFPAAMVIVGAHYLPFVHLYGMRLFAVLAGVLSGGGVVLLFWLPAPMPAGAWFTGVVLLVFAVLLRASAAALHRQRETTLSPQR
ncbi:DUF7010 family protein [Cryobacterium sp. W22_MBD10_FK3]|uniref:DUF7010 family protein n=1 Tax=Cryobacterium sp. W22_MBD10_FK3 TaxID=3240273 RepID=UPI003F93AE35